MTPFATKRFTLRTTCAAACVWALITETGEHVDHLYGLAVRTTWRTGAALSVGEETGEQLSGRILRADPPHRLSYVLRSGPGQPSVYVTWEIQSQRGDTLVGLYVDEPALADPADIEAVWAPVIASVEQRLHSCVEHGAAPTGTASDECRPR